MALHQLMEGTIRQLETEAKYFSSLTRHGGEKGRLNESHLMRTLRRYLPAKFGLGTGFIVSGGENPQRSRQCDIIIYDAVNNAPFFHSDAWQIYPIEMVYCVIEVKTTLNGREMDSAMTHCASLRQMCGTKERPNKAYAVQKSVRSRTPAEFETIKRRPLRDS